jgi:hypothetical protein
MNNLRFFARKCTQVMMMAVSIVLLVSCSEPPKQAETPKQAVEQPATQKVDEAPQAQPDKDKIDEVKDKVVSQLGETKDMANDKFKAALNKATGGECETMLEGACLTSKSCILEQGKDKAYFCRAANEGCEMAFVQSGEHSMKSCKGKKVCKYEPASCYCPPKVQCVCGGGKPASCALKSISDF